MTLPSILIIESDSLLGAAIERLLSRDGTLNVVGITPKSEVDLITAIWRMQPDTIVLSQSSRLTTAARLLNQFRNFPNLQIIAVNPCQNSVEVYGKKRIPVAHTNDLVTMVQSNRKGAVAIYPIRHSITTDWRFLLEPANAAELS